MSRDPLRVRIPAALALEPMTVDVLARCLAVSCHSIRDRIDELRAQGIVEPCGIDHRGNGRPFNVYRIAA